MEDFIAVRNVSNIVLYLQVMSHSREVHLHVLKLNPQSQID